ncbi:hypothetical protein L596_028363 [Steinernema carpocapsae]|uniref:Uncharacterized protein n=1 Tax=Steinernema carpocapsae TaxID=34508 RepID=A0A4U5LYA8_STECR|nr:hypothetical protein L596_028363 [Steinernema carpocapsae]
MPVKRSSRVKLPKASTTGTSGSDSSGTTATSSETSGTETSSHLSDYTDATGSYNCTSNSDRSLLSSSEATTIAYVPPTFACALKNLLVMRHGERTDDLFPGWIERSTRRGRYVPYDLNMPRDLRYLNRPMPNFHMDTPLTMLGGLMAQFLGRAMASLQKTPDVVYASPALRCVQTAHNATIFSTRRPLIRLEPGLFENTDLYPNGRPKLMTAQELKKAGFRVDLDYKPVFKLNDVWAKLENNDEYNDRLQKTFQAIADREEKLEVKNENLTVLVCAHASTVDMAIGHFIYNRRKTTKEDLLGIADRVPYSSFALFNKGTKWNLDEKTIPFITYEHFTSRFDRFFVHRRVLNDQESSRSEKSSSKPTVKVKSILKSARSKKSLKSQRTARIKF